MYFFFILFFFLKVEYIFTECLYDGFWCSEQCDRLYKCIGNKSIPVRDCSGQEKVCNMIEKRCTSYFLPGSCAKIGKSRDVIADWCDLMPHPTDCTKYIKCIPKWEDYYCGNEMFYNAYTMDCENENANCTNDYDSKFECTTDLIGMRKPHNGYCSYFEECVINEYEVLSCPTGKSYNPNSKQCDNDLISEYCQKGNTVICDQAELYNTRRLAGDSKIISLCVFEGVGNG